MLHSILLSVYEVGDKIGFFLSRFFILLFAAMLVYSMYKYLGPSKEQD